MSPLALASPVLALLAAVPPQEQPAPAPRELSDPLTDPAQVAPKPAAGEPATPPPLADPEKLPESARALTSAPPEALVRAHPRHAKGDPLEGINRRFFRLNAGLDRAIFRPAALGYKHVVPEPVRSGFRNFFSNLMEPVVFLNFLLQLKPGKAVETLARFTVNTAVGLVGFVDVAKRYPLGLRHRDNGFGSTLGRYGVGPGPYLYLPFAGPTTLRDLFGGQVDRLVLPFTVQRPPFDKYEYQLPRAVITGLDARAEADGELEALYAGAVDPYATLRSVFLQNRAGEIEALRHPRARAASLPGTAAPPAATPELNDPLADPARPPVAEPSPAPELSDPLIDPATPASPAGDPTTPARR